LTTFVCFRFGVELPTVGFAYVILIALFSLLGSLGASILLSIVGAACLNYFFTQPLFSFRIDLPQDALAVAAFTTTSLAVTGLTARVRKLAEATQAAHQALIDTLPAMVWTALPDGSSDFDNRRWAEFTGLEAPGAIGDNWVARFHPEDRATVAEKWRASVATGEPFDVEARTRSATGDYRAVLVRAAPLRDEGGAIVKWYGVATDIEDRRRAMETLRANEEELARVSRVTTLGVLAGAISHEVKQPIGAIVTNAQAAQRWLQADRPNIGEMRQALERIVKDGIRACEVITRVHALIKKAPPRRESLDINEVLQEVIALTRVEAMKEGVSVQIQLAADLPSLHGDRVQLQQVILNLIINAIEAMSGISEGARELLVSTGTAEPGSVLVAVRDSGPGLDPGSLNRVFETFYTTKPGGVGMGLSICRSIIQAHGGRMWAAANEPCGAAFQFILPSERSETVPVSSGCCSKADRPLPTRLRH
jgi:PAS domain S-box-containing protein